MQTISVIGTGYLGATHAAAMAEMGHRVIGIDVDKDKVTMLGDGRVPFFEPALEPLIRRHTESGRLTFSEDFSQLAAADIHFICVGTPQSAAADRADLSQVLAAADAVAEHMRPDTLVVGKSTVPVGTAAILLQRLREATGGRARLAWNPEFLREGYAVQDTLNPDRIVMGVVDSADAQTLRGIYRTQIEAGTPIIETDFATAELVKVAANSFLATKISFINAMADVCQAAGADVTTLARAIGHDPRIGEQFLRAGIGFGGGCLPKDVRAFLARGDELGVGRSLSFLRAVDEINMRRRTASVQQAAAMLGDSLIGSRVAILGVAFKPDSDDVRDSPALDIAAALHLMGAKVVVHDPKANRNAARSFPTLTYADSWQEAVTGADLTMLLTEWREFRQLDPVATSDLVAAPLMFDGRNALEPAAWRAAGWTYQGIGIP